MLRFPIAISDRRRVNWFGGGLNGVMRVLTKFQVNLVIPEEQYLWLYFNQRREYVFIWGFL